MRFLLSIISLIGLFSIITANTLIAQTPNIILGRPTDTSRILAFLFNQISDKTISVKTTNLIIFKIILKK
jgi:hypothetical protein